ncbi:MAG: hypothetical protein ACJ72O_03810 [Marmoricola sp.]
MSTRTKRPSARRVATFVAALGALVMSSGAVLLATAPAANADKTPVNVCHATSSDSNPYTFITVDNDSTQLTAHLAHRNDPNKRWKSDGTFNGVAHTKGQPKPDIIGDYVDPEGNQVVLDGVVTLATCQNSEVPPPPDIETTASVTFTNPSCDNDNTPSYATEGDHVTFELDGTVAPGEHVTVTATVDDGYTFADDAQSLEFEHTFTAAVDCTVVTPPDVTPPVVSPPDVATPTVVHAGLAGSPMKTDNLRSQQGIALLGSGLVLLVAAGGLARPRRVRS